MRVVKLAEAKAFFFKNHTADMKKKKAFGQCCQCGVL
jgi:hypothetical protein